MLKCDVALNVEEEKFMNFRASKLTISEVEMIKFIKLFESLSFLQPPL